MLVRENYAVCLLLESETPIVPMHFKPLPAFFQCPNDGMVDEYPKVLTNIGSIDGRTRTRARTRVRTTSRTKMIRVDT